ncbi:hypothetical protein HOE22_09295 [Candidatus Woesearchaeota archaeon]|jgi:hypothetical protein|nr:hypothetical protein [Candidatus Woesearchaeota archaeon]
MNKITLDTFIQKYNLGGSINSVKWESTGDTLSTRFISPDKSLLGELTLSKQTLPEFEVGVYDTPLLSKMIGTLADKVDFSLTEVDNMPVAFKLSDSIMKADYVLAAIGVIPDVPALKNTPEFNTIVNIDSQFINSFIRGKGALGDVDTFAINPVDGGVEFVIGYSDINSNRISIKAKSDAVNMTDSIVFNANLFKELLNANKECSKATLQISDKGLAHIEFNVDDFNVKYWLVSQQV